MATVLARQLRCTIQSSRSLTSISKQLRSSFHQQPARLKHRPSTMLATSRPTRISLISRPLMASASSQEQSRSNDMEWDEITDERQIQWMLEDDPDKKWGWVIYRCSYKPELQNVWENFKHFVDNHTRKDIAESDAPDIAEKLDWAFVEDPKLEGASLDELKRRFRSWARSEVQGKYDIDAMEVGRGSRHTYFIQVDEGALQSLQRSMWDGYVNIVRGWEDPLPPEEATDQFGDTIEIEDWMKIQASMVASYFYVDLENDESWYAHYSAPPHGLCIW